VFERLLLPTADFVAILALSDAFGFRPQGEVWYEPLENPAVWNTAMDRWWSHHGVGFVDSDEALRLVKALRELEIWLVGRPPGVPDQLDALYGYRFNEVKVFLDKPSCIETVTTLRRLFEGGAVTWRGVRIGLVEFSPGGR